MTAHKLTGLISLMVSAALITPAVQASPLVDPTPAPTAPVIDYCAKKSSGAVRAISQGTCRSSEMSLGKAPITKGAKRPLKLRKLMANRVKAAQAAGKKKGHVLRITSGWRSLKTQKFLFERSLRVNGPNQKWVLPPKLSNHPWGLAVDINYRSGKKAGAKWLETNGYKWGLCRAYKNEWWHFEPLTTPGTKCPEPIDYPVW